MFIEGEIDDQAACSFIKKIMLLTAENPNKEIDVLINSPGGEINSGLAMYDVIQSCKTPIRVFCIGRAYSMAAVLFASGRNGRYMFPHSELMLHEPLLANPRESTCAYDPMKYIESNSDITFLAKSIVKADPQKEKSTADPYWDQAAVSLLSAEIAYTRMRDKDATFADVLELHDMLSIDDGYGTVSTSLDALFEDVDEKSFSVSCWKSFKSLPVRTAGCVFGTLNTTIDTIFTPELREMIANKPSIDFEEFAKKKTAMFVTTSAVNPSLHFYVNMFYAQAFKQLFEYAEGCPDGALPIPVHMLCDDFACGGRVLNFPEYISIFREKDKLPRRPTADPETQRR